MKALQLDAREEVAFASAALALRFGARTVQKGGGQQLGYSLWTVYQRVQENATVAGNIDRNVSLNRALWMLAEEMRKLKA